MSDVTQRNVTDALRRDEWLKSAIGRELGFPAYLTDDSVQAEVVLLDPIPLLGELDRRSVIADHDDTKDDDSRHSTSVPWPAVGYAVDLYMPAYRLVIEADGPSHWCRGTDEKTNRALGRTVLKHRLLRDAGYLLVSVPSYWSMSPQDHGDDDAINRTPAVATAWSGDADAWKSEDLAGAGSRNWPQQPSERLGGRLLELVLASAEETHELGERRWDAAKEKREMDFLTDGNGRFDSKSRPQMKATKSTSAARRRQRQRSASLRTGDSSIFLSRRPQKQKQQAKPSDASRVPDPAVDGTSDAESRRQKPQGKHRPMTSKHQRKKRNNVDPERIAAAQKLKARQRQVGGQRGGSSGRLSHEQKYGQQARSAKPGERSEKTGPHSTADQAVHAVKLPLNPYVVLGLAPGATRREIKQAFRALSLRYHPDRNSDAGAASRFAELGAAAEQLLQLEQPLGGVKAGDKKRRQRQ